MANLFGLYFATRWKKEHLPRKKSSPNDTDNLGIHLCDGGNAERWLINYEGSISDVTNDYVLEVNKDQEIVAVKR